MSMREKLAEAGYINLGEIFDNLSPALLVEDETTKDTVDWGKINKPFCPEAFAALRSRQKAYLEGRDVFVFDGYIGADEEYRIPVRVINEYAWRSWPTLSRRLRWFARRASKLFRSWTRPTLKRSLS